VFLHGICGAGKSTIGLLLAKELKGSFCHTFNPTNPGDSLHNLVREAEVEYDEKRPLVIVIEEVNTLIRQVHANEITLHKNVQTSVYNKSTYNTFMDDMALYKNVVLILTSNESVDEVNAIDPCYLRTGRVDAWYSMMNEIDHEKAL
jgi:SpoVK/Ycf46/Vps4 family AAA+-type ATPase